MTGVHLSSLTDSERRQLMPNQTIRPRSEKRLLMPNPTKERLFSQTSRHCCIQCCGSMKFWYGSGSADPYPWQMDPDADPDPAIFVSDLQEANKKLSFLAYYFLKVHLHHFSMIKSHKEVTKQYGRNQRFSYYFCLMIEGGSGYGSVSLTNGSGCGSGRPKNIWILRIRIRNTDCIVVIHGALSYIEWWNVSIPSFRFAGRCCETYKMSDKVIILPKVRSFSLQLMWIRIKSNLEFQWWPNPDGIIFPYPDLTFLRSGLHSMGNLTKLPYSTISRSRSRLPVHKFCGKAKCCCTQKYYDFFFLFARSMFRSVSVLNNFGSTTPCIMLCMSLNWWEPYFVQQRLKYTVHTVMIIN